MKKNLRILLLVHESLIPPDTVAGLSDKEVAPFKTEFDVMATLRDMGHTVWPIGIGSDLGVIQKAVDALQPDLAFNLLEEFAGVGVFDAHVASYLEAIKLPTTGCNPRGLTLAHNKAIAKMICRYHRIPVPAFHVFPLVRPTTRLRRPNRLEFPLIVKSLTEEGSVGIAQASVVHDDEKLFERIRFIHRQLRTDALVEHYIDGRELYVGVLGNDRLQTLPIWEIQFNNLREGAPKIATDKIKWDDEYQKKIGLTTGPAAALPDSLATDLPRLAKRVYRALQLSGYARLDFRLDPRGRAYLLEANPNPQLMYGEDFAESAEHGGIDYAPLLQKILNLGLRYRLIGQA
ncbi:MAG: D-alanine--D-alanine ligase [Planctomycetota bacterium]